MWDQFASALAGTTSNGGAKKDDKGRTTTSPTVLREDLYKATQAAERWLNTSTPGDSFSYRPVFNILKPHYPDLEIAFGSGAEEVSIIVGAITNLALELGGMDTYGGVVALRSWVDVLDAVIRNWKARGESSVGTRICEGIVQGVNTHADPTYISKEFAARVQIVNILKTGENSSMNMIQKLTAPSSSCGVGIRPYGPVD